VNRREIDEFEFDYVEAEEPRETERPLIDDMQLFRLNHCAISSAMGYSDQGFPNVMRKLASFNFVTKVGEGYKVTSEGLAYLSKWRKKLETI